MPNTSQKNDDVLHCHQLVDDFTLVTTPTKNKPTELSSSPESNKENWVSGNSSKNYQTVPQTIAAERLQLLRSIELEHSIFTLSFLLIETFFRPSSSNNNNTSGKIITAGRRKRGRGRRGSTTDLTTNVSTHHFFTPPRKRIFGLSKAYKAEYASQMNLPGVSKHFATFYNDLLNWQLVFASLITSDVPTSYSNAIKNNTTTETKNDHLATELNYDALFDYEDAIAATANLLSIARQHSDLLDGLVLRSGGEEAEYSTTYVRESPNNYGGESEFRKLVGLVETLLKAKKERVQELKEKLANDNETDNGNGHILSGWFKTGSASSDINVAEVQLKNLQREVNAWEEFLDLVEISAKWIELQLTWTMELFWDYFLLYLI